MLEMYLNVGKVERTRIGYFIEELSNTQFTTYANLSSLAGITQGTLHNEGSGWLRFDYFGTELIVSKKTIRHSVSWNFLNDQGCVFGETVVVIKGSQYKVRLLRGTDGDPANSRIENGYDVLYSRNTEWPRLFYPLVKDDTRIPVSKRNPNAPYTNLDLGMTTGDGRYNWCRETPSNNDRQCIVRGGDGVTYLVRTGKVNTGTQFGWRPCLELIP